MVGFLIVWGLLVFFQLVDFKEKREKGEDRRGVVINFILLFVLLVARLTNNI